MRFLHRVFRRHRWRPTGDYREASFPTYSISFAVERMTCPCGSETYTVTPESFRWGFAVGVLP